MPGHTASVDGSFEIGTDVLMQQLNAQASQYSSQQVLPVCEVVAGKGARLSQPTTKHFLAGC